MTKQQEIDMLAAFVASIPEGTYLQAFAANAVDYFAREVRNDFLPNWPAEILRQKDESLRLEAKIVELRKTAQERADAAHAMQAKADAAKKELARIADAVKLLSRQTEEWR